MSENKKEMSMDDLVIDRKFKIVAENPVNGKTYTEKQLFCSALKIWLHQLH